MTSIVIVWNNIEKLKEAEQFIQSQDVHDEISLFAIDNRGKKYSSAAKAYNFALSQVSLWLYYYEIWVETGEWVGGGKHGKKKQEPL